MHLTLAQKFQIAEFIKQLRTPDGTTYQAGWCDSRVAQEFGVNRNQVRTVRTGAFEGMSNRTVSSGTSTVRKLTEEVSALSQRITALERLLKAA